ncbi:NADPH-dependent F420 reductase [Pseudoalteromonas aurantia]|uniref:Pyrroline-5-carboxylate reductase catalytic N-terminal domain-containing protein n=1 Tax=Pseudoalteromonas aurantia 208 TaxID=1314867 RepID=A0ABR9ED81_9GAMM|nr:NAD(P)-binding domain-containing protein [Pseudoalteromonas aurantia]MBE0368951.1 hypothetical protein [Pseudoalteromonas aurantia 208]
MKIAVIGTGMVGRSISAKLVQVGHEVVMGTRDVQKTLAQNGTDVFGNVPLAQWQGGNNKVTLKSITEAAKFAELLFVCTHGSVAKNALDLADFGDLKSKTVIDVSNGLVFGAEGEQPSLSPVNTTSIGEKLQKAFPEAHIVKTLNNIQHTVMVNPSLIEGQHNVFMSGNNKEAKSIAQKILNSFGWESEQVIDLGNITYSRAMEMNVLLWWRMYEILGTGEFNFQLMKK